MVLSVAFLILVAAIVASPGLDVALVLRNTIARGRRGGLLTVLGISSAASLQGVLVACGLAAVIVHSEPLFLAVKWAGAAYLGWMALASWRAALRPNDADPAQGAVVGGWGAWRQGFLCNITNPKILVFYLSLLPQFVAPDAPWWIWLAHAWAVPAVGTVWLCGVVVLVNRATTWLRQPTVRRLLDAAMGTALAGMCLRVARDAA